jgi:uncharacterized membrane protein YhaH (DUF805 family)
MGFTEAIASGFANYANFSGRAQRSAYWWWALFTALVSLVTQALDTALRPGPVSYSSYGGATVGVISGIVGLLLIIPSLAVLVRRLHDTDRSGWWWFILIIPVIGWLAMIYFLVSAGTPGPNRYGPPPVSAAVAYR